MAQSTQFNATPEELDQLRQFRASASKFKEMVILLPDDTRSAEHNQQFNQLRSDARALLKSDFADKVPRAITGDVTTDRTVSIVVILGVIMALIGLGVNAVILDDVVVNSLGCCVSSGGMLFIIGAFVILVMKHYRQRVSNVEELHRRCDLLLYQIDHRLQMSGVDTET